MASNSISFESFIAWLAFRRSDRMPETIEPRNLEESDPLVPISGVRCPLCKWQPTRQSRWTCWDCDHPEYFYNGCGTDWNTFETRGVCPTCAHQWIWTSCLRCAGWSRHAEWYEQDD